MTATPNPNEDRMPPVTFIEPDGTPRTIEVAVGTTLMMAALDARIKGIEATCLGDCMCATCHVIVAEADRLPPPGEDELETLENVVAGGGNASRLSCQITMTEALAGLTVTVAPSQ
jgi:2Fe-2S ferredoxin